MDLHEMRTRARLVGGMLALVLPACAGARPTGQAATATVQVAIVLRDAEHYLFRRWITASNGFVIIPDGVPFMDKSAYNPSLIMHSAVMGIIHDPLYNFVRKELLEKISHINKTTPEMTFWEERGYQDGIAAREPSSATHEEMPPRPPSIMGHRW